MVRANPRARPIAFVNGPAHHLRVHRRRTDREESAYSSWSAVPPVRGYTGCLGRSEIRVAAGRSCRRRLADNRFRLARVLVTPDRSGDIARARPPATRRTAVPRKSPRGRPRRPPFPWRPRTRRLAATSRRFGVHALGLVRLTGGHAMDDQVGSASRWTALGGSVPQAGRGGARLRRGRESWPWGGGNRSRAG